MNEFSFSNQLLGTILVSSFISTRYFNVTKCILDCILSFYSIINLFSIFERGSKIRAFFWSVSRSYFSCLQVVISFLLVSLLSFTLLIAHRSFVLNLEVQSDNVAESANLFSKTFFVFIFVFFFMM